MAYIAMTLTDPVSGYSVPVQPVDGVSAMSLDVQPSVRAVAEERVGASGMVDSTVNLSAAAVTLTLRLWPSSSGLLYPEEFLDQLGPLLNPGLRPVLVVTNDQWPQARQLTVRFDSKTAPVSDPSFTDVVISWKALAGTWEAAVPVTAAVNAFIASSTGLSIDPAGGGNPGGLPVSAAPGGLVFPATSAASPNQVTSPGAAASQWTALLYGPCAGPSLANDSTGQAIAFRPGLVLNAGDFVALDSAARTAQLNGDPSVSASVLKFLSFPATDWWQVQPGLNVLRFFPQSAGAGSQALLTFRPAWPA